MCFFRQEEVGIDSDLVGVDPEGLKMGIGIPVIQILQAGVEALKLRNEINSAVPVENGEIEGGVAFRISSL